MAAKATSSKAVSRTHEAWIFKMGTYWPWRRDPDRNRPDLRHTRIVRKLVPKAILVILSTLYK
jgi:hypothetical protein